MRVLDYLFSKGYYPRPKNIAFSKAAKAIFNDPKHQPFKDALLDAVCKKMAEHMEHLSQPVKNLEMKGEYNAIYRLYEEMADLFMPEKDIQKHEYADPLRRIDEESQKAFAKKEQS